MRNRVLWVLAMVAASAGCTVVQTQKSLDSYLKGQLAVEKGDLQEALRDLSEAIKADPRMGVAYIARGKILMEQGQDEEALPDSQKAVELEPNNFRANVQLGTIYQRLKRFAEAVVAFDKARHIRPQDAEANMDLALAYAQNGDSLKGLYYGQLAAQFNSDSATVHANLGVLYAQCGAHDDAIKEFKTSIELNSKQPEVYANLAQEYLNSRNYQQAKNVLETARALVPTPLVYDRLGAACCKLEEYDQARVAFNEALKLDPKYCTSLNGLGVVAMSKALLTTPANVELAKEALGFWNKSLEINKDQPTIAKLVAVYAPQATAQSTSPNP